MPYAVPYADAARRATARAVHTGRGRRAQGREFLENLLKDADEPWCKWLDADTPGTSWVQLSFKAPPELVCRLGHALVMTPFGTEAPNSYPSRGYASYRCDMCGATGRTDARFHCNECTFDMCGRAV